MAAWVPLLTKALPLLTQIASTAIPHFTSKTAPNQVDPVIAKQIAELQAAAVNNAESSRTLAEKLQQTIQGIHAAAKGLQKQLAVLRILSGVAAALSVVAVIFSAWALMREGRESSAGGVMLAAGFPGVVRLSCDPRRLICPRSESRSVARS